MHFLPLDRTVIEITGADRKKFLHNFCTADILRLEPGSVCEAMILDGRGRILGIVHVLCRTDSLGLNTVAGQAPSLIAHLEKYIIREDVTLRDESGDRRHWIFLPEPGEFNALRSGVPAPGTWIAGTGSLGRAELVRAAFAGDSVLFGVDGETSSPLEVLENSLGWILHPGSRAMLDRQRILQRVPWFGVDCGQDNLPQEMGRDAAAISFTKGCYLGQETVARIDALGHVNRQLVVVRSLESGELPETGVELRVGEKAVGRLTSIAPDEGGWTGLAIVRRESARVGSRLAVGSGIAEVVEPQHPS